MQLFRKKDGFTLIELLIVILTGTIVTAAATTILLLALRINRKSLDIVERQSVLRIMMTVMENMGSDGEYIFVNNVEENEKGELKSVAGVSTWSISEENDDGTAGNAVICYDSANDIIKTGTNAVLVENVTESLLYKPYTPFTYVRDVYTFSATIQGKTYESTVYSRTQEEDWRADDPKIDYEAARNTLVDIVSSQVGSDGLSRTNGRLGKHYNLWYLGQDQFVGEWTEDTPWCSTFVSWALEQVANRASIFDENNAPVYYLLSVPKEANVNHLWLQLYNGVDMSNLKVNDYSEEDRYIHIPKPGDLIFFEYVEEEYDYEDANEYLEPLKDLSGCLTDTLDRKIQYEKERWYANKDYLDDDRYIIKLETWLNLTPEGQTYYEPYVAIKHYLECRGDGLDHVGVVVKVTDTHVYTVEGNTALNKDTAPLVAVRRYALNDQNIFGYATLNWNEAYK